MSSRTEQCGNRIAELQDNDDFRGQLPKDILRAARENEKLMSSLLDDSKKTDLRIMGNSDKSEDNTNDINTPCTEIMAKISPHI